MADEADVESALVDLIVGTIYLNGTAGASAISAPAKIYRGWPLSEQLQTDLAGGIVNVTVFARNGVERVTTRYDRDWYTLTPAVRTVTATISGNTITIGGTVSSPQNVAVIVGQSLSAAYAVQAGDTLASVATGLAAALSTIGVPATASGPTITVPGTTALRARIGGVGIVARELRRQDKSFQITIWSPTPDLRDVAGKLIDTALSDPNFISLPDGTNGLIRYERSIVMDTGEKVQTYRRDLFYWVEYPTIETQTAAEVVDFGLSITGEAVAGTTPSHPVHP